MKNDVVLSGSCCGSELVRDGRLLALLVLLHLSAMRCPGLQVIRGQCVPLAPGEVATTQSRLGDELGLPRSAVRSLLSRLETQGLISIRSAGAFTVVKVETPGRISPPHKEPLSIESCDVF